MIVKRGPPGLDSDYEISTCGSGPELLPTPCGNNGWEEKPSENEREGTEYNRNRMEWKKMERNKGRLS